MYDSVRSVVYRADVVNFHTHESGDEVFIGFHVRRKHPDLKERKGYASTIRVCDDETVHSINIRYPTVCFPTQIVNSKDALDEFITDMGTQFSNREGQWDGYITESKLYDDAYHPHARFEFGESTSPRRAAMLARDSIKYLDNNLL